MAKLTLKLRKVRHGACRKKCLATIRLSNPEVRKKFVMSPHRIDLVSYRIAQTEITIHAFNIAVAEPNQEILGYWKRRKEEWIRDATWTKIKEWKAVKGDY